MAGSNMKGCIIYYGMPETDSEKLKQLNGPVLGFFAKKDAWITPEVVQKFESQMKGLGKSITIESYDADHAFANPSNPKYNKEASAQAYKLEIEFLKKNFEAK
jgi:carboxymethylenebutenolidase